MNQDGEYYVPKWASEALNKPGVGGLFFSEGDLFINTLEGEMHVSLGDHIIQGVQGELYPCKPDIFEETYEVV